MLQGCSILRLPMNGGLDESTPANKIAHEDFLRLVNYRSSENGTRIEKRKGYEDLGVAYGEDVFGYHTYYDSDGAFCQLVITESKVYRKTGSGTWDLIHTFSSLITHKQKVLEIQGKQFIINEVDSIMIHTDKAVYRIGITKPAGTMTLEAKAQISAPGACTGALAGAGAGNVDNGDHKYKISFVTGIGETGLGTVSNTVAVTDKTANGKVSLTLIPTGSSEVTARRIFRTKAGGSAYFLLAVLNDNSTASYTDNTADASLDSTDATAQANTTSGHMLAGVYKYAVTYYRGGNFGCESNPSFTMEGTVTPAVPGESSWGETFTGAGLDDLVTQVYGLERETKSIRVRIRKAGATDRYQVSLDGGTSYSGDYACKTSFGNPNAKGNFVHVIKKVSKYYDSKDKKLWKPCFFGTQIKFGAATGHHVGDYWVLAYKDQTTLALNQYTHITAIPISADPQVTGRNIYRTLQDGTDYYFLASIDDNTTTTFDDDTPDTGLGELMEEDHDVMPNAKFAAWWDNRLWVTNDNLVYYSDIDIPEQFDTSVRYVIIRTGTTNDEITGFIPYRDLLYTFKRNSIWTIERESVGYGRFLKNQDIGNKTPFAVLEVNGLLMFISDRGLELYNGADVYSVEFSLKAMRTIKTIDNNYLNLVTATHVKKKSEVWFSLPDVGAGETACVLVYNYMTNRFYRFEYPKVAASISAALDSTHEIQNYYTTRDGYVYKVESGYTDAGTVITAKARKGWIDIEKYGNIRRFDVELELPTSKNLTVNLYMNFDKDVFRAKTMAGGTPAATDIEIRRPIYDFGELGLRGKYFSIEFVQAENAAGDHKINEALVYYLTRATKQRIAAD